MKKVILFGILLFSACAFAQDLPTNPEPGKCYVRCKTPDVWKNEDVTIQVSPAYKKLITRPAEYTTVTETVTVKEASQRLEVIPAVYETQTIEVVIREAGQKLRVIPASYGSETISYTSKEPGSQLVATKATFRSGSQTIETKAASAQWAMSEKAPDCQSSDPNDCRYWCYKEIPSRSVTISTTELEADAATSRTSIEGREGTYKKTIMSNPPTTEVIDIPAVSKTIKKTVMVTPPTTRVIDIPAETKTITKTVLAKDAWAEEVGVDAQFKTVTKEVLVSKGGLTTWKEVDCALTVNSALPVNWNTGSATLTSQAKSIIDSRLVPVLTDGVAVEIASHTDSRGSATNNQSLSERRAQAVVNYLISKGINPSQLVANGYGEARLLNRCADGVSCNESEHKANRRTTFRVINQK